jgi:hypothetical protein
MTRYLLFFLLFSSVCQAQDIKQQIEQELKRLEKEDPEAAKMVKQLMGNTNTKPTQASSATSSHFLKKISLKKPVTPPSATEARDRLFCFKGKKIDAFTLITTTGTLVQYRPSDHSLVIQPDSRKDEFKKIITEMDRVEKRKNEFIEMMDKGPLRYFCYPYVKQGLDGMDDANELFAGALGNTMELPAGAVKTEKKGIPAAVMSMYNEVMRYVEQHKNDQSFSVTSPPVHAVDYCFVCDSSRQAKEALADSLYHDAFCNEEYAMLQKVFAVLKAREEAKDSVKWNAIADDMFDANVFLYKRMSKKCDVLLTKYGKDITKLPLIIRIVLSVERQMQLLGIDDANTSRLGQITDLLEESGKFLDEQIAEKNYGVLLNYQWIISLERMKQLLGGGAESFVTIVEKLEHFNRFKLTLDAEVKVVTGRDEDGNVKDWVAAKLNGDGFFSLFPDTTCGLRLISNKRSSILGNEAVSPKESYELTQFHVRIVEASSSEGRFAGPYEWSTAQPMLSGSHCHASDTLVLYAFAPYNTFEKLMAAKPETEKWNFPEEDIQERNLLSGALSMAFPPQDITEETGEPDENAIVGSLMAGFGDNNTLNNMKMRSNLMNLETGAFSPEHTGGLFLRGTLKNKAALVFEAVLNGKDNNPDSEDVLVADLHVQLEHTPVK